MSLDQSISSQKQKRGFCVELKLTDEKTKIKKSNIQNYKKELLNAKKLSYETGIKAKRNDNKIENWKKFPRKGNIQA